MTALSHDILFNFGASPIGGGLKRLAAYAQWFDAHGGARFIVHPRCESLRHEFPRNHFVVARQSSASRVLRGFAAVDDVRREYGTPDCYFAFGIPLSGRVGRVNWFHQSNVLPLAWRGIPMSFATRLRFRLLGMQTRRGLQYADVISAESRYSLSLFDPSCRDRLFLSVTGSDDEIAAAADAHPVERRPTAVVVGTYLYKDLDESLRVFEALKEREPALQLQVFGAEHDIPAAMRTRGAVVINGERPRSEVIDALRHARYYISTTMIEGSYNAASEGIFLAEQSYISDIGPHRELLAGQQAERMTLPNTTRPVLRVRRDALSTSHLMTWAQVIADMNGRIRDELAQVSPSMLHERQAR